ncbi:MAG: TIM-barrel domain-containing protein, partial [Terracidiphilus sp.]
MNRRHFVQLSTAAALAAASRRLATAPAIQAGENSVQVKGANFAWEYSRGDDSFKLKDGEGRLILSGTMQPAVVVAPAGEPAARLCSPGQPLAPLVEGNRVTLRYRQVNGGSSIALAWRFDEHGIWMEPVIYTSAAAEDVVSLHLFSGADAGRTPSLHSSTFVVPGLLSGSAVSPVLSEYVHLNESVWLGRGSFIPGLNQQWGLPVHSFCGFSISNEGGQRNMFTAKRSQAFCCGLADLPSGDLFLQFHQDRAAPWVDYRSDLWHNLRGPARLTLGATLLFAVAEDTYGSIAAYYDALVHAGIVRRKQNSARKTAAALTPQFCTWGVQVERHREGERLDQAFLESVYGELRASGMKAGLFSIDDKWEGTYGNLEHDPARFPRFEEFLDRLRADGMRIGVWAALMRCERPADLGLREDQMLKRPDGSAYRADFAGSRYYILDFTRPEVAKVLAELARRFVRRYKPDLLKFDFGYELPAVGEAASFDKSFCGERLMKKGLDVVIPAMRQENPDLVVMYYNLSPLLVEYFDLHSPDDLYQSTGEYQIEANRRFWFSSLLGRLGVPTYGSTGYDWASAPEIWFDSAAVGTIGSLNDFQGDEQGLGATPERIARYNGIARCLRTTAVFETVPLGTVDEAPTLGAHARSWARFEEGELVLLA